VAVLLEELELTELKRGRPIVISKADVTLAYNVVGSAVIEVPANTRNWELIQLDSNSDLVPFGVVLTWNDGAFEVPLLITDWDWKETQDDNGQRTETLTLIGDDFLALLANRVAYPNPLVGWTSQTIGSATYGPDPAETVIKDIVTANLIDPGDTARQVSLLTVAEDQGRGSSAIYKVATPDPDATSGTENTTVQQSLMDMVRTVDEQSPIGVQITLGDGELVFDCYEPRDLSELAVFSASLGNLPEAGLSAAAPTANAILAQSKVTGATFTQTEGTGATDPWRRVETFLDQSSTDTAADVTTAANQAIAAGASRISINVKVVDLPRLRFGADGPGVQGYRVGDIVTLDIREGVTFTDVVSKVQLVADATGDTYTETVTPTIGTATDDAADQTISSKLSARLRALERALRGSVTP
jgi:hypothetical protein